ncbi:MAG: hypothetical protein ACPH3N_04120 [Alcanivorax sediminis]|uniref:DUF3011 domain-containing protein n=1 Tax=Alcanivorax sediminis TaxID=2663008 RepID=A0A6N7LTL1_9GAMM|nr:hypothetical protein [Alcanivorax sediminis]MQX52524.1 hypothetical protein [Alcanivorax sediminis]
MKKVLGMAILLSSQLAAADYSSSVDSDTCWDGLSNTGSPCMVVADTKWSTHTQGKFIVTYRNVCSQRIYARFCNERNSGSADCGASGILPGSTKGWSTYKANGRYSYNWVGVTKPSKDWVCSGKVSGWND